MEDSTKDVKSILENEIITKNDIRSRKDFRIGPSINRNDGTPFTTIPMWKRKRKRRLKNKMARLSRRTNRRKKKKKEKN